MGETTAEPSQRANSGCSVRATQRAAQSDTQHDGGVCELPLACDLTWMTTVPAGAWMSVPVALFSQPGRPCSGRLVHMSSAPVSDDGTTRMRPSITSVGSRSLSSTDSGTTLKQCDDSSQSSRYTMTCSVGMQRGWSGLVVPPASLCQSCQCMFFDWYASGTLSGGDASTGSRHIAEQLLYLAAGPMRAATSCRIRGCATTEANAEVDVRSTSPLCHRPDSPVGPPRASVPRSVQR